MKKIALSFLILLSSSIYVSAQNEELYITIFVSHVEDQLDNNQNLLVLQDSIFVETPLEFDYNLFIAGFDTLSTASFEISLVDSDGTSIDKTYSISEINANENLKRFGDSVTLPFGRHESIDIQEYTAVIRDQNNNIIESLSGPQ